MKESISLLLIHKSLLLHLFFLEKKMSDIVVPGFQSSQLMADLNKAFEEFSPEEKQKLIKQVKNDSIYVHV